MRDIGMRLPEHQPANPLQRTFLPAVLTVACLCGVAIFVRMGFGSNTRHRVQRTLRPSLPPPNYPKIENADDRAAVKAASGAIQAHARGNVSQRNPSIIIRSTADDQRRPWITFRWDTLDGQFFVATVSRLNPANKEWTTVLVDRGKFSSGAKGWGASREKTFLHPAGVEDHWLMPTDAVKITFPFATDDRSRYQVVMDSPQFRIKQSSPGQLVPGQYIASWRVTVRGEGRKKGRWAPSPLAVETIEFGDRRIASVQRLLETLIASRDPGP